MARADSEFDGFSSAGDDLPPRSGGTWMAWMLAGLGTVIVGGMFFTRLMQVTRQEDFPNWIGKPAPRLELTSTEGASIDLADLKGKTVVVNFWATWCPPCRAELPELEEFHREYGDRVVLIGVSDEPLETIAAFAGKSSLTYLQATPTAKGGLFNELTSIPTTVVIDSEGVVKSAWVGTTTRSELAKRVGL